MALQLYSLGSIRHSQTQILYDTWSTRSTRGQAELAEYALYVLNALATGMTFNTGLTTFNTKCHNITVSK